MSCSSPLMATPTANTAMLFYRGRKGIDTRWGSNLQLSACKLGAPSTELPRHSKINSHCIHIHVVSRVKKGNDTKWGSNLQLSACKPSAPPTELPWPDLILSNLSVGLQTYTVTLSKQITLTQNQEWGQSTYSCHTS